MQATVMKTAAVAAAVRRYRNIRRSVGPNRGQTPMPVGMGSAHVHGAARVPNAGIVAGPQNSTNLDINLTINVTPPSPPTPQLGSTMGAVMGALRRVAVQALGRALGL